MVSEIMVRKKLFMAFVQSKPTNIMLAQVSVTSISHAAHEFLKKISVYQS